MKRGTLQLPFWCGSWTLTVSRAYQDRGDSDTGVKDMEGSHDISSAATERFSGTPACCGGSGGQALGCLRWRNRAARAMFAGAAVTATWAAPSWTRRCSG